ncbi:Eco57I restriction-modification methylase domain-containing protein [Enterococcus lemanii]|uniref:Eco57I restriction-modification methylase domain-containing protein n=1 Tax=Enterococcus lemanii TaxID=1159752 RepID=A0ABV9MVJ1_9ENTE|nr:Eco57I restriction-modification methylase domain-containing protein [Enterococcus lemanii]MBM7709747.1 type II restriction enzyme [Enterococcus lemanii]
MNESVFEEQVNDTEDKLLRNTPELLKILLRDRTTNKNIIWATSTYERYGKGYGVKDPIKLQSIMDKNASFVKPRTGKRTYQQKERTKGRAEVFTPTWIVALQNQVIEQEFQELPLEEYIAKTWLELTCGEAPYMVNRYDAVTGEGVPIKERVGFVDRKLQRINAEIVDEKTWLKMVDKAYQASYGYEFQGDSLLIARENLLYTFIDYYQEKFGKRPELKLQKNIATIISHNVFQMDGLQKTVPYTEVDFELNVVEQLDLFGESSPEEQLTLATPGTPVKIKNWQTKKVWEFQMLGGTGMKFDVVIGNPPYQEEAKGDSSKDMPVYHKFIDESYKIGGKVLLITPARYLSNAGATPKNWNEKMLNDEHLKITYFEQDSSKIFPGTDIKGGLAVTYHDEEKNFGAIEVFTPFLELHSILRKVMSVNNFQSFSDIVTNRGAYRYSDSIYIEYPEDMKKVSDRRLASNAFRKLPDLFHDEIPNDEHEYIQIYGRYNNERVYKWFRKDFMNEPDNFYKFKIILPKANGSGAIGEVLSTPLIGTPLIGTPLIGYTETFIGIGTFDTELEASAALKYLKSKFARAMLGILKITQDNTKATWAKVPLQDFTTNSDIDWSQSIAEIDQQLYAKYGLDEAEITFIESKVKEME